MIRGCFVYRVLFAISLLILGTLALNGCGGSSTSRNDPPAGTGKIPVVAHVFVLVEENHAYNSVIGNNAMPYTNSLANQYALATQFYANRRNSLPNYFMLTVGDLVTTDDTFSGTVSANNVVRVLSNAGKSWRIYAESLPNIGYKGPNVFPYARDHNPFAYFQDVINSSAQTSNMVPLTQLSADIQNNTLPDYATIVPNLVNDGHDCPQGVANCTDTDKLSTIDAWVKTNIGPLIASSAFQDSVLI